MKTVIKVVEWLPEPGLDFERAFVAREGEGFRAQAVIGGIPTWIDTKGTLLDGGVAICEPVDSRWAEWWPLSVKISIDEGNGIEERVLEGVTADAKVVEAARKFSKLCAEGAEFYEGMPLS